MTENEILGAGLFLTIMSTPYLLALGYRWLRKIFFERKRAESLSIPRESNKGWLQALYSQPSFLLAFITIFFPPVICGIVINKFIGIAAIVSIILWLALAAYVGRHIYKTVHEGRLSIAVWSVIAGGCAFFQLATSKPETTILLPVLVAVQVVTYIALLISALLRKRRALSVTASSSGYQQTNVRQKATHEYTTKNPDHDYTYKADSAKSSFKSIAGMDYLKERLHAAYSEMLASTTDTGVDKRNGILLYGEPGNGKTFYAESLAGQIGWPIIKCTFGDVNSSWVGQTTERVVQVFDDAIAQAPCVLFIDEIDALLVRRDKVMQAESETSKTVNTILTKLVEVRDHQVLVVAATNFLDRLDSAAIREGRFDYKIEVPPPDLVARKGLLRAVLRKHAPAATMDQDAIDRVALRWEGFSVSRIKAVAFEAAKLAKAGKRAIDFDCLTTALRSVQGSLGERLPENAKSLDQMQFDDDVRATLNGLAVRMRDIDEIERMGGSVPTGVLFYGPPGTGKTATVRALAKSSGWALLTTSGQDLSSSDGKIDEIDTTARNIRPCIVFIDEADDILANRQTSWNKSMTNKVLSVIDGAGGKSHDILWVAATNHPESIDSAALRGGRFTEKIEFRLPSVKVVEKFVRTWDEKNPAKLDSLLTHERIASLLHGQAIANIEAIMQAAVNNMISRTSMSGGERVVMQEDIKTAYVSVVGQA